MDDETPSWRKFGHIPGVPIFSWWDKRQECSDSGVHRSVEAGICGNSKDGTYSVALSGPYRDDKDDGDVVIYTGAGGRANRAPPRSPQTSDQTWGHRHNKALMISSQTGNPIRLIRGWNLPSKYAPDEGYRYDGLYRVVTCWIDKGSEGFDICRCRLERLPDQPPVPTRHG